MVLVGTLVVLSSLASRGESEGARLFSLKIYPVLKAKCFACHGEDPGNLEGDLNLLSREGMLEGGALSDRVLVEGRPEESDLYRAITWEEEGLCDCGRLSPGYRKNTQDEYRPLSSCDRQASAAG